MVENYFGVKYTTPQIIHRTTSRESLQSYCQYSTFRQKDLRVFFPLALLSYTLKPTIQQCFKLVWLIGEL